MPRYRDSVDNTVENSRVFSLVQMNWLPSARAAGSKTSHQQNPPVLNWRCWLTCIMAVKRRLSLLFCYWCSYNDVPFVLPTSAAGLFRQCASVIASPRLWLCCYNAGALLALRLAGFSVTILLHKRPSVFHCSDELCLWTRYQDGTTAIHEVKYIQEIRHFIQCQVIMLNVLLVSADKNPCGYWLGLRSVELGLGSGPGLRLVSVIWSIKKVKVAHTRLPSVGFQMIPVLGSQPPGDVSHKPSGRLPLLFTRPAVTLATLKRAATNSAAWWTEARWVWTVCLRLLPNSVATAIWTRAILRLSPAR